MTAKLNQIIAVEKGIKSKAYSDITQLHKAVQKPELFNGFTKVYNPKADDDSEKLPMERKRVQFNVKDVLNRVEQSITELMDVTQRKDYTNCAAKANVVIDGNTLIEGAPTPFLLFLEKQLNDLYTFIDALPVLDVAEDWALDANSGLYKSAAVETHRTKKVSKPLVLYPATTEHPAQTQMVTEDVIAGFWVQVKQSGAMPVPEKQKLMGKVLALQHAVKAAREEANMADEVSTSSAAQAVFNYLMED